jgi:pilus assembly protein Flp/PilA
VEGVEVIGKPREKGRTLKLEQTSNRNIAKTYVCGIITTLDFFTVVTRTGTGGNYLVPRTVKTRLELMKSLILTFFKDESGATAIEYGLIAAGIAIAIITAVQGVGTQLSTNFVTISTSLK